MLSEIRKGNIDVVVCWKGDRLAQSVSPANALLEALEGTETELEATHERLDKHYFVLMACGSVAWSLKTSNFAQ